MLIGNLLSTHGKILEMLGKIPEAARNIPKYRTPTHVLESAIPHQDIEQSLEIPLRRRERLENGECPPRISSRQTML